MTATSRPRRLALIVVCLAAVGLAALAGGLRGAGEMAAGVPPVSSEDPPRTVTGGASVGLSPPLSVVWTSSMGPQPTNTLGPLVVGDRVYVTHDGKLRALDARTGAQVWEFSPEEGGVSTSPLACGELIIVGTDNKEVVGLAARDGNEVWKTKCDGPVVPDPLDFGEVLILGAREKVYAIEPTTGRARWESSLTSAISNGPITDGFFLYFLCQDGSIQSMDPKDGRFRWASQTLYGPRAFPPIIGGRRVVVASGSRLMAVARSGAVSWTAEMPAGIGAQPTLVGDTLWVPCVNGEIYELYARSGRSRHRPSIKLGSPVTAPVLVSGDLMIAGTAGALLYVVETKSGAIRWLYRCRGPDQPLGKAAEWGIYAPVTGGNGAVYCLTGAGDLYCFSGSASDLSHPSFAEFKPEPGDALPGEEHVALSFVVIDDGSGVDLSSVAVTVDGNPVGITFNPSDGTGATTLAPLADGSHVVKVVAKDFRGNAGSAEWSFLTDASIAAEAEQPAATGLQPARRTTTLRQGGAVR